MEGSLAGTYFGWRIPWTAHTMIGAYPGWRKPWLPHTMADAYIPWPAHTLAYAYPAQRISWLEHIRMHTEIELSEGVLCFFFASAYLGAYPVCDEEVSFGEVELLTLTIRVRTWSAHTLGAYLP